MSSPQNIFLPLRFAIKKVDMNYPKVIIKKKKAEAIGRRHPWIFSGAIARIEGKPKEGDIVQVLDYQGNYLATGHFQKSSIAIRLFSFTPSSIDYNFWVNKLQAAYLYRQKIGIVGQSDTNVYRLVHAEGDGLPSLIIDVYGKTAVIQTYSWAMHLLKPTLVKALQAVLGENLVAVYDKSTDSLSSLKKMLLDTVKNGYLYGTLSEQIVTEHGHRFWVDWEKGQKTGFFIDQRENRRLLAHFVKGKQVLNAFCYSGGFSIYALKADAKLVHSVDSSQKAIQWTEKNVALNGFDSENKHKSFTQDVGKFLQQNTQHYDVMVLDPPAFAKHRNARHSAIHGYKHLNTKAFSQIKSGGVLFTFSCSQVISRATFYHTITAAAIEAKRNIRVLHHLSQPPDHPVNIFHPEGEYLKGLVLYVE